MRGVTISRSQLSKVLRRRRGFRWRTAAAHAEEGMSGSQTPSVIDVGFRLESRKAQAEAGDIVLLFCDESEALTHPYLRPLPGPSVARILRVPAPRLYGPKPGMPDQAGSSYVLDNGPIHVSKVDAGGARRASPLAFTIEWLGRNMRPSSAEAI